MPEPVFGPVPPEPRWVDSSVLTRVDGRWRLLGSRCRTCDARFFPRAYTCASCLARDLEPVALAVEGRVHVSATAEATQPGFAAPARFAWVDLPAEGVRVFAHLVPVEGPEPGRGEPVVFDPAVVGADAEGPLCSIAFRLEGREG